MSTDFEAKHPRTPAGAAGAGKFRDKERAEGDVDLLERPDTDVFHTHYDTMQGKLSAFRDELKTAFDGLDRDEEWQAYLDAMAKFHHYSSSNRMLIALQGGGSQVAGYRTWKALGRQVRKGEHGIQILAPRTVRSDKVDADGEVVRDERGRLVKTSTVVGFTTATVFDISQTDGEPLPEGWGHMSEEPPPGYTEDLEDEIRRRGYTLREEDIADGSRGYTTPTGEVVIDRRLAPADRAQTLAHELGHIAAGHLSEDNLTSYVLSQEHHGRMEIEAESIAYVLSRANGYDDRAGDKASARYLKGWSTVSHDPDLLAHSAQTVDRAAMELLRSGGFRNVDTAGGAAPRPR